MAGISSFVNLLRTKSAQFQPSGGALNPVVVYPADLANGQAIYPAK